MEPSVGVRSATSELQPFVHERVGEIAMSRAGRFRGRPGTACDAVSTNIPFSYASCARPRLFIGPNLTSSDIEGLARCASIDDEQQVTGVDWFEGQLEITVRDTPGQQLIDRRVRARRVPA